MLASVNVKMVNQNFRADHTGNEHVWRELSVARQLNGRDVPTCHVDSYLVKKFHNGRHSQFTPIIVNFIYWAQNFINQNFIWDKLTNIRIKNLFLWVLYLLWLCTYALCSFFTPSGVPKASFCSVISCSLELLSGSSSAYSCKTRPKERFVI